MEAPARDDAAHAGVRTRRRRFESRRRAGPDRTQKDGGAPGEPPSTGGRNFWPPPSTGGRATIVGEPGICAQRSRHVPNVEAHITGTVWKIEVEVGDTVEEGDTVVILESMKMEMPVEAEDEGRVSRDPLPGGSVRVRGRRPRRPRVSVEELAEGKLRLDHPAPDVARLTIHNPEKRNALDHAILDAITHTVRGARGRPLPAADRRGPRVLGRLRHRRAAARRVRPPRRVARRPPLPRRGRRARRLPLSRRRGAQRAHDRRRARARADLRPADRRRVGQARDAAREARARLLAHGPAQVHRRDRGAADPPSLLHAPATSAPPRRWSGAWSTRSSRTPSSREHAVAYAAAIAANAPLSLAGNKRVIRELLAAEGRLEPAIEAELVALREACFRTEDFYEGVRAFAEKRPPQWQGR